jgi:hypothetical protein
MAWIVISPAKIQNRLTKQELTVFTTAAAADTQTPEQILADAISAVTSEVRGYVGCKVILGPEGTIPDELENASLALLRRNLATRLPKMAPLFDETRKTELEQAIALLRDTAKGNFKVVPPVVEAVSQPSGSAVQVVSSRPRLTDRNQLAGL